MYTSAMAARTMVNLDSEVGARLRIAAQRAGVSQNTLIDRLLTRYTEDDLHDQDRFAAARKHLAGSVSGVYPPGYLADLRAEWPA